jgi:CheY-like chemotaxis protein
VFDDDPEFVALMEALLEEEGYACLAPPDPSIDVRAALRDLRPDLAIVDLRGVSDDDGIGLIEGIRADPDFAGLPMLVCSADLQTLRARAAQLAEMPRIAVLEKPFRIEALVGALQRLMAGDVVAPRLGGRPSPLAVSELETWLDRVGRSLRWDVLDAWSPDDRPGHLRCIATWCATDELEAFERLTRRTRLPFGAGLPGRIWVSGRPAWVSDLASDMNFPRLATARRLGLTSAAAVPVVDGGEIVGVLAAYARRRRRTSGAALDRLVAAGAEHGPTFRRAWGG